MIRCTQSEGSIICIVLYCFKNKSSTQFSVDSYNPKRYRRKNKLMFLPVKLRKMCFLQQLRSAADQPALAGQSTLHSAMANLLSSNGHCSHHMALRSSPALCHHQHCFWSLTEREETPSLLQFGKGLDELLFNVFVVLSFTKDHRFFSHPCMSPAIFFRETRNIKLVLIRYQAKLVGPSVVWRKR